MTGKRRNFSVMSFTPEKLNLWDRFFNRYRKEVIKQDKELWETYNTLHGVIVGKAKREYERSVVHYRIVDRLTGSERIEIEYLN